MGILGCPTEEDAGLRCARYSVSVRRRKRARSRSRFGHSVGIGRGMDRSVSGSVGLGRARCLGLIGRSRRSVRSGGRLYLSCLRRSGCTSKGNPYIVEVAADGVVVGVDNKGGGVVEDGTKVVEGHELYAERGGCGRGWHG